MKVYMSNIEKIQNTKDLETKLSESELSRLNQFNNEKRRLQYLVGHAMVRDICGENIKVDLNGALSIESGFVSISHKDNLVFVAVSNKKIGIDIENADINRDFISLSNVSGFLPVDDKNTFYKNFTKAEADFKFGSNSEYANHYFYWFNNYILSIAALETNDNILFFEYDSFADISHSFVVA